MTDDELTAAKAIRTVDGCGLTIDGEAVFCDHPKADQDYGICHCKAMARAALSALREAGYEVRRATE